MAEIHQILLKLLDGKTKTLNFTTPTITVNSIKSLIQSITSIPISHQFLLSNGKTLKDDQSFTINHNFRSINLLLRLRGGKGGFGSLLRGAATKAGQKKTNNFDACRDMSGRRLRHVNAEKKMEEWKAEAEERRLEKVAEEFIKRQVKEGKKQGKGGEREVEKYVEKYMKDSAKCMEEVDKSVRESLGEFFKKSSKRKVDAFREENESNKKLKIWKGKNKLDGSDSDDTDEDDSDDEMDEQIEKSVVINNGNLSHNEADGSSGSVTGGKTDGETSAGCLSESTSEEEKGTTEDGKLESSENSPDEGDLYQEKQVEKPSLESHEESIVQRKDEPCSEVTTATVIEAARAKVEEFTEAKSCDVENIPVVSTTPVDVGASNVEVNGVSNLEQKNHEETATPSINVPVLDKPLDFKEYTSAAEMEVLGMERLKIELQERGLKCGGSLKERAARLFLLKTTPVDKLPKKLLAKK